MPHINDNLVILVRIYRGCVELSRIGAEGKPEAKTTSKERLDDFVSTLEKLVSKLD